MLQCPKCSADNLPESRFCSSCAEPLSSVSQMPTVALPESESPQYPIHTPNVRRLVSSDSIPAGGFTPGTILADRYRIIGLLGRGGMGEVYRADDLKLGQPVALKFLPAKLAEDAVRRERFFAEVRITRQLSHPNICRVYDISDIDGRHFLSMEYIDGEDLASLMTRIGHLTDEKALDIARQLLAGLSVAHERGVLHRDLKPANIMLDGHGRVRITDFGLAIATDDGEQAEEIAGTPAYMAPEQLEGKGATVRSDIYALGLILYEIYTGRKAFTARTLAELRQQKETHTPRAPSEIRPGIDPVVERLIARCMEKDPNARPAAVAQLAQALPGGDPLAAAIAAGETPSPEMVAASGSKEGMRPALAWSLLAVVILCTIAVLAMNDRIFLHKRIPFEKSPDVLVDRCREIIEKAGYTGEIADSDHGFIVNSDLKEYLEKSDEAPNRWKNPDPEAILFWYRQSPERISTLTGITNEYTDLKTPGDVLIVLDSGERLVSLEAVPIQDPASSGTEATPDWPFLFNEAGLDFDNWTPVDTQWKPLFFADTVAAWEPKIPGSHGSPVRIEAAAAYGKPISFRVISPWTGAGENQPVFLEMILGVAGVIFLAIVVIGGVVFARRNLRLGRGDRRNARRLAVFFLGSLILIWILALPHSGFLYLLLYPYIAGLVWILYIAVEPFMRRRWPRFFVSWTRLLSGNWRDALVAREVLIGCTWGTFVVCVLYFGHYVLPPILGYNELAFPIQPALDVFMGTRYFICIFLIIILECILLSLLLICLLFILILVLRYRFVAIAVCCLGLIMVTPPESAGIWSLAIKLVLSPMWFILLIRYGLTAATFSFIPVVFFVGLPSGLNPSGWYSGYGYATLAIWAVLVLYAFRASLGGQPLFGTTRLGD